MYKIKYAWWPNTENPNAASTRIRCLNIINYLNRHDRVAGLYRKNLIIPKTIILSKRYDTESVNHAISLKNKYGTRIALDICDNHFYYETRDQKWIKRSENLEYAISICDIVIVASTYLKDIVKERCNIESEKIHIIEDAAESPHTPTLLERLFNPRKEFDYQILKYKLSKYKIKLVWFGNHGSSYAEGGMSDLNKLHNYLETLSKTNNVSITIISNNKNKFKLLTKNWKITSFYIKWNRHYISELLKLHDICLIPITENPFTLAKSENRAVNALLHNLFVIADEIPSYKPLANMISFSKWSEIEKKISHKETHKKIILEMYGIEKISAKWLKAIDV